MKDRCDKIKDRLSAYLDGELSPDEMAEIAAHLETCRDCSALLEKMRRLDNMAEMAVPDFDDEMMDSLAGKIMDGIDTTPAATGATPPARRVIPIWYRYVAVAASIVIVFLAGRMAFKESSGNLLGPTGRYEMIAPAAEDTTMPYRQAENRHSQPEEIKPDAAVPLGSLQRADEEKSPRAMMQDKAVESEQKIASSAELQKMPAPAMIESVPPTEGLAENVPSKPSADMAQKMSPEEPRAKSELAGKIAGRIVDAETGKPLPGVTVQLQGTTIGAKSDTDGDYTILSVPPDTYNLTYSSVGYEPVELTDVPVYPGQTEEMTVALQQESVESGTSLTVRGGRAGATTYIISPADSAAGEMSLSDVDSLDAKYAALVNADRDRIKARKVELKAAGKSQTAEGRMESAYRRLIDSLNISLVEAKNPIEQIETSYLRLRAAIDLANATGEAEDKSALETYEADFNNELTSLQEQGYDPKTLEIYRNRLEKLKSRQ